MFFHPGGTLEPGAESYITRKADAQLLEALIAGEYAFLLDSRQKGKSSLVARTILKLRAKGVRAVKLDLQRIGANVTPEQWYAGLVVGIGQELGLVPELLSYWENRQTIGPLARFVGALQEVALPRTAEPLVVFVDEVDFVRALDFSTDEFFAAIRECYNRRSSDDPFKRLTFCLVGVATPGQLIRNPDVSPFNIGVRLELTDFTLEETRSYAGRLEGSGRDGALLMSRVHHWVGGHPYLTQLLCSHVASSEELASPADVDRLVRTLLLSPEARQHEPNLADVERRLLNPDVPGLAPEERLTQVLELYGRMLRGTRVQTTEQNPVVATLRLSGIGHEERGVLRVRNRTYATVFDEGWRRQCLPEAELRRRRSAARLAAVRTAAVAGVVLLAVSSGAFGFWQLSNQRQGALDALGKRTEELKRTAGERQKALADLESRNQDLSRVSAERQEALTDLKQQNEELTRVSREREQALVNLKRSTRDLTYSNYLGLMATARLELSQTRYTQLPELVDASKDNPNRGWEWGHLALEVSFGGHQERFPKWTILESRPHANPMVVTPTAIHDLEGTAARPTQEFSPGPMVTPRYSRGMFRVKMVDATRGDAIFDAQTDKMLVRNRVYSMVFDVDPKRRLYLLGEGETLDVIQLRTIDGDRLITAYKGPDNTDAARFLPDNTILSIHQTKTANLGEVRHWDQSGKTLDSAPSEQQNAHGISLSPDGAMYAAWGFDRKVEIRWVKGHRKVSSLPDFPMFVSDLQFSSDGKQVLVGCDDGIVRLFDTISGKRLERLVGHRSAIYSVAFMKRGAGYASVDSNGLLRIWPPDSDVAGESFLEAGTHATHAVVGADGRTLVSVLDNALLVSRNLDSGKSSSRPVPDPKAVSVLTVAQGCTDYYVGRLDGRIERISGLNLRTVVSARVFATKPTLIEVLPGGKRIFAGTEQKKFAILDAQTLRVVARIEPKLTREPVDATGTDITDAFAYDGETPQLAIFLGEIGKIQVFSATNGRLVKQWSPGRAVRCMTFVEGGRQLVASLGAAWWVRDGQTILYDVGSGRRLFEFKHPGQVLGQIEYAPATGILAGKTNDRKYADRVIYLWDLRTRARITELPLGSVTRFSLSPDGERILTYTMDNAARLWDSRTGKEVFKLPVLGRASFTKDGRRIVQFPNDGSVRVSNSMPWK